MLTGINTTYLDLAIWSKNAVLQNLGCNGIPIYLLTRLTDSRGDHQGRKKAMKMLKTMLEERRANPRKEQTDFFDYVLEELQRKDTILTEAIALDLMFVLLFASFETTSLATTVAIKLLHDHPLALKKLTVSVTNLFLNNQPHYMPELMGI